MLVNLQLLVNFALIPCSCSRDCYFNMAMGLDCAVGNIWSANCLFSLSETELRRTQLNQAGSTKTQPTYNICCRGGRRDWCPRSTAHKINSIQIVTHPDINPVQQGLTSVNRREPVFLFGANRTRCRVHLCPEMHPMTKMADLAKELHNWRC